jgi:peptidoglycan/xylan/chitin deacetylase (PgdA/CDA1 family)
MPKTEVAITIDTEFEVNGALGRPAERDPIGAESVYRMVDGQSHGLGFILDTLAEHALPATFFVEVLNSLYFGPDPITRIIDDIHARGQDVQLHAHPCWRYMKGRKAGRIAEGEYTDSFMHFDAAGLREVIDESVDIFQRLTGTRPVAFRSGGLHVTRGLYPALHEAGIALASNIGVGLFMPVEPELRLTSGIHHIDGVTEVPVLSYAGAGPLGRQANKVATIIGSSWSELRHLLNSAHARASGPVVILTHASEYSSDRAASATHPYRPSRTVQQRLVNLCRFLRANDDRFDVVSFAGAGQRWPERSVAATPALTVPITGMLQRLLQNNVLPRLGVH